MARKQSLRDRDYANIAIAYREMPHEKAEKIRRRAIELSRRELGLSTVQQELARLRREHPKSPLDKPWSLASLKDNPVDVFTINFILHTQAMYKNISPELKERFMKENYPLLDIEDEYLTVRMANWISRLLQAFGKRKGELSGNISTEEGIKSLSQQFFNVLSAAGWYSVYEIGCEWAQVPVDTRHFDAPTLEEVNQNILNYYKKNPDGMFRGGKQNG